jgi:hypothetical protein
VHGEKLIVGIAFYEVTDRRQQFQPYQQRKEPSNEEAIRSVSYTSPAFTIRCSRAPSFSADGGR